MEIANSPVPIAAVLYQKIHILFLSPHETTCSIYYSKNHSMTLLWDGLCLFQQISLQWEAVKAS